MHTKGKKLNVIVNCGHPSRKNSYCGKEEGRISFETRGKDKRQSCKEVANFLGGGEWGLLGRVTMTYCVCVCGGVF